MRLFVALEIPAEVRERLASLIRELRAVAPQLKWVRIENVHLTLKFIGETEDAKLSAIRSALAAIRLEAALELRFRGLGFFPNDKRPRVFWAGIDAPPELAQLASSIDGALAGLGFPREERSFAPHLTLARLDGARLSDTFRAAIAERATQEFGGSSFAEFLLIESKLKSTGAEYTTLQNFCFASES